MLQINRSKRDQEGRGASVFVCGETLEYMDRMKELYPRRKRARKGCILPIGERQIANRIKAAAEWAGLSGQYSGHSPRIGAIQDLAVERGGKGEPDEGSEVVLRKGGLGVHEEH